MIAAFSGNANANSNSLDTVFGTSFVEREATEPFGSEEPVQPACARLPTMRSAVRSLWLTSDWMVLISFCKVLLNHSIVSSAKGWLTGARSRLRMIMSKKGAGHGRRVCGGRGGGGPGFCRRATCRVRSGSMSLFECHNIYTKLGETS